MKRASPDALRLVAMGAILAPALVRAMTADCTTPYWDVDPLLANLPETTLLPSMGLALDALVWLGVGAAILGEGLAGRRILWKSGILLAVGVVGVLLHALFLAPIAAPALHASFPSLIRGSAWAAAMGGAWAIAHLARDNAIRRTLTIALLGFVLVLAGVGAYQYFVEHAITVRSFDADPAGALAAQGIEPGTPGAQAFERRLRQPEALGWLGLANVFGSFAAASLVGWIGLAITARRARHTRALLACVGTAVVAAGAVAMSGSKGAVGAAVLALGVLAIGSIPMLRRHAERRRWLGPLLALGVVGVPWAAVAARGMIGERLAELSLLFRSQYAVGALRIIAEHPFFGVGPAGFKIAYATAKLPAGPEWVDSPHAILLDWAAALGLFAIPWVILWLTWIARTGRAIPDTRDIPPNPERPDAPRAVAILAILLAILFAWRLDVPTTLPAEMAIRALAGALWIGLLFVPIPVPRLAIAGAALAMGAHMQLEMTGIRTTSAQLAMLLIGLAAAPDDDTPSTTRRLTPALGASLLSGAMAVTLAFTGILPALRWERHLRAAAAAIHAQTPAAPRALAEARDQLVAADGVIPSRDEPLLDAARLSMVLAQAAAQAGKSDDAARDAELSITLARRAADRFSNDSVVFSRLGVLLGARHALLADPADLARAAEAWEHAAALDPLALTPAVQAWRLETQLGHAEAARDWARRALALNANLHLDPLIQLSPGVREAIERSLRDAGRPGEVPPMPPA